LRATGIEFIRLYFELLDRGMDGNSGERQDEDQARFRSHRFLRLDGLSRARG
jgi:hypothetical protein